MKTIVIPDVHQRVNFVKHILENDKEYDSIRDFFRGNRDLKTWKELISGLEGVKKNRDLEYAKKYIEDNKFQTYQEPSNGQDQRCRHRSSDQLAKLQELRQPISRIHVGRTWRKNLSPNDD
jgi:hypothetical protein